MEENAWRLFFLISGQGGNLPFSCPPHEWGLGTFLSKQVNLGTNHGKATATWPVLHRAPVGQGFRPPRLSLARSGIGLRGRFLKRPQSSVLHWARRADWGGLG